MQPARERRTARLAMCALALLLCLPLLTARAAVVEQTFVISNKVINLDCAPGANRLSSLVNGVFPGPTITATEGDTIIVHVQNKQPLPVTIHWHGLFQRGTQWYDGVPGITQCGIQKGGNYTYKFQAIGQRGTFWWHSHLSTLRDSVFGALIVRAPATRPEPFGKPIDKDFVLVIGDYYHKTTEQLTASATLIPDAIHVNGRTAGCNSGPQQVFTVVANRWYRMRVINGALWGQLNVQIQGHTLYLFETEGNYLKPYAVSSLDLASGQSYSLVFQANKRPDNYWIAVNARYETEPLGLRPGVAVLSYSGVNAGPPPVPVPPGPTTGTNPGFGASQEAKLKSLYSVNGSVDTAKVSRVLVFAINQNVINKTVSRYSVNNVSVVESRIPYLYADYANISGVYDLSLMPTQPPPGFASAPALSACKLGSPDTDLPLNGVVQLVVQNHLPPGGNHPFHLHGHDFYVVAQGSGTFNGSQWQKYTYNTVDPPRRNTQLMLAGNWIALRFVADNPGQWIMHCHLEPHVDHGMQMVFRIRGPKGSIPPPPSDYPACGSSSGAAAEAAV